MKPVFLFRRQTMWIWKKKSNTLWVAYEGQRHVNIFFFLTVHGLYPLMQWSSSVHLTVILGLAVILTHQSKLFATVIFPFLPFLRWVPQAYWQVFVPHLRQNPNPLYCPHIPFRIISISFLAYREPETPLLLALSNFSFLFSLELWVIKTSPFLLQQNCLHNRVQRSPNYCFQWSAPIGGLCWNGAVNVYCPGPTKQYLPSIFVLMKSL